MGTRHIIQVIKDGKTMVSQYGQWDGYPDAAGVAVLEFARTMDRPTFDTKVEQCVSIPDAEIDNVRIEDCPTMSRSMGSDILHYIQDSDEPVKVWLDLNFVNESLFCEWAYVLDLDNNKLEVYQGFNTKPVPANNRFQLPEGEVPVTPDYKGANAYYPITLVKEYYLSELPSNEDFIRECDPPEEEQQLFTNEAMLPNVMRALRDQSTGASHEDKLLNQMLNYIEANVDDFLEAIED